MKDKTTIYLEPDIHARLNAEAEKTGVSASVITEQALYARLPETGKLPPVVEFLLRHGKPSPKPSWSNGGRWFLDWLLMREPDWQRHHLVMLPRCWPVPFRNREARCDNNCGDPRSLLDHLAELRDPFHRTDAAFPRDLPDPTEEEWLLVCRLFEGCCGEYLRAPTGAHWEIACTSLA